MAETEKQFFCKIYNVAGDYITTWDDATFTGFSKYINGGLGECEIQLARPFDNFGEDYDVKFANEVQIWVSDVDSGSQGTKIYSGFISRYEPYIDGSKEGVRVRVLGYVAHFGRYLTIIDEGGGAVPYSSTEISTIVKGIVDNYNQMWCYLWFDDYGVLPHRITWDATSIPDNTGVTLTYTFNKMTPLECVDRARAYAPANWWWYIGADNLLQFKPKPSQPTHRFVFGKDFKSVKVQKNIESLVTAASFYNCLQDTDANYVNGFYYNADEGIGYEYMAWVANLVDGRFYNQASAETYVDQVITENGSPQVKTVIEIIDNNGGLNGYDIESINPGDTCTLLGLSNTSNTFEANMTITQVDYTLDKVTLTLSNKLEEIGRQVSSLNTRINDIRMEDAP